MEIDWERFVIGETYIIYGEERILKEIYKDTKEYLFIDPLGVMEDRITHGFFLNMETCEGPYDRSLNDYMSPLVGEHIMQCFFIQNNRALWQNYFYKKYGDSNWGDFRIKFKDYRQTWIDTSYGKYNPKHYLHYNGEYVTLCSEQNLLSDEEFKERIWLLLSMEFNPRHIVHWSFSKNKFHVVFNQEYYLGDKTIPKELETEVLNLYKKHKLRQPY